MIIDPNAYQGWFLGVNYVDHSGHQSPDHTKPELKGRRSWI